MKETIEVVNTIFRFHELKINNKKNRKESNLKLAGRNDWVKLSVLYSEVCEQ